MDSSQPLQGTIPEHSHSKANAVTEELEFGSGFLGGRAARDLSWSSILMRASDMEFWIAVRRMISA